jgi:glycerol-3-phosphate acyltransferase PlsY
MQLWSCPILAFLLGSIPFGLIISKAKGINIREQGSGNIGATNVLRVVGKKYGYACLLLDVLKGFVPVVLAINLIQIAGRAPGIPLELPESWIMELPTVSAMKAQIIHVITALCAVLGHNYSPWVNFKGGKGISTSGGVLLALMPFAVIILLAIWGLLFITTRYVSIASVGAAVSLPFLTLWGSWHHGRIQDGTWNKPLLALTIVIAILAVWKHRVNFRRLMDGTEHRFGKKSG